MKKLFFISALLCASVALMAETELVDWSKVTLDSWGGGEKPVVTMADQVISIQIVSTPGWQWGNQVKITLGNVAEAGLSKDKEYKMSFTAVSDNDDCGGVTFKFFDNNQLFFTDVNYLKFSKTPYEFESEWLKLPEEAALTTNGTIVFDFGWDPAQTIKISKLSLLERESSTSVVNVVEGAVRSEKVMENGQLVIIKDGVRYNANGTVIK